MTQQDDASRYEAYGQSEHGNFSVMDEVSTPHPYVIGPRHVAFASDHHGGVLDRDAIEAAEQQGARCKHPKCNLSFAEHERTLLVRCKADFKGENGKANPELHAWLMNIKDQAGQDGYAGFAFKRDF